MKEAVERGIETESLRRGTLIRRFTIYEMSNRQPQR